MSQKDMCTLCDDNLLAHFYFIYTFVEQQKLKNYGEKNIRLGMVSIIPLQWL